MDYAAVQNSQSIHDSALSGEITGALLGAGERVPTSCLCASLYSQVWTLVAVMMTEEVVVCVCVCARVHALG